MLGILGGTFFSAPGSQRLGQKRFCELLAVVFAVAIALISLGRSAQVIIVGRFLIGKRTDLFAFATIIMLFI